jgi:D-3-phosphoglycerate dehydrogenase / 2-oxoglutarate reductase
MLALVASRQAVWRRPVASVAFAGGPGVQLADSVRAALDQAPISLVETTLHLPDGWVPSEVSDADILISGDARIDESVADQLTNVRFLLRPYVGYDDIDVDALTRRGILFANVPDAFTEEVANHTLALILAGNRKLLQADAFVRRGDWSAFQHNRTASVPLRRASTLTLGLVGFGRIGRAVAERARAFGFRLLAADPYIPEGEAEASRRGARLISLDELLAESDIVSLHVFLNAETRHLMDARRLAQMKPGAYLVNTARGPVVDEQALIGALQSGHLAGAALDVFETEPLAADSPLLRMQNVILSPHVGSYSVEADQALQKRIIEIVMPLIKGDLPDRAVVINTDVYDSLAAELASARVS